MTSSSQTERVVAGNSNWLLGVLAGLLVAIVVAILLAGLVFLTKARSTFVLVGLTSFAVFFCIKLIGKGKGVLFGLTGSFLGLLTAVLYTLFIGILSFAANQESSVFSVVSLLIDNPVKIVIIFLGAFVPMDLVYYLGVIILGFVMCTPEVRFKT